MPQELPQSWKKTGLKKEKINWAIQNAGKNGSGVYCSWFNPTFLAKNKVYNYGNYGQTPVKTQVNMC